MRLISQLIKGIWRVFQKNFKYFSDSVNSTSFFPLLPVMQVIFCLDLNEALLSEAWKLATFAALVKAGSSL